MNASEDGSATETARQRGDYSRGAASSGPLVALSLERGWAYADDLAGVRDDAQTRRPKTVGPTFALADFGAEPSLIVIDAFLRAEALDRPTVSHKAELAMAARAVVLHSLFFEWHRSSLLALLSTPLLKRRLLATCIGPMLPDLDFVSCVSDHAPTLPALMTSAKQLPTDAAAAAALILVCVRGWTCSTGTQAAVQIDRQTH